MRSLVCVEHPNWESAVKDIRTNGGKAGQGANSLMLFLLQKRTLTFTTLDWIADKERSKFAFESMCWERSYIPLAVWKAGDSTSNLVESVHADVNREGVGCTLVGGILKGQRFDILKSKTLKVSVLQVSYR